MRRLETGTQERPCGRLPRFDIAGPSCRRWRCGAELAPPLPGRGGADIDIYPPEELVEAPTGLTRVRDEGVVLFVVLEAGDAGAGAGAVVAVVGPGEVPEAAFVAPPAPAGAEPTAVLGVEEGGAAVVVGATVVVGSTPAAL